VRLARPTAFALLLVALAAGCGGSKARGPKRLSNRNKQAIAKLMRTTPFGNGKWGLLVTDMSSGQVLDSLNATTEFQAASTTKNFTVAAALQILGPGYHFHTPVVRSGKDLILVASGDLTLGGRDKPGGAIDYTPIDHTEANNLPTATLTPENPLAGLNRLARQVAARGVHSVQDVAVDDRLWKPRVVGHSLVTPIIVNDNVIDLIIKPTKPGRPPEVTWRPRSAAFTVDVRAKTVSRKAEPTVEAVAGGRDRIVVTGNVPDGKKPLLRIFHVPDPSSWARTLFIEALERAGVRVESPAVTPNPTDILPSRRRTAGLPKVAELVSLPFSQEAKLILKVSHNLGANSIPFLLGRHSRRDPFAAGMTRIEEFAVEAGVDPTEFTLRDGQGLSGNTIAPQAQVQLLRYMAGTPSYSAFFDALPIQGIDVFPGSEIVGDPALGKARAKTGLQAFAKPGKVGLESVALAGYIHAASGRRLAYDVVVNNVPLPGVGSPDALYKSFTSGLALEERITTVLYKAG
jgi:serine-type D-Ala-D-Ala carboxypeptidase/endopeptidase (penicillin-binding protein 4)